MPSKTTEYGHTKLFQNAEQKALHDAIEEHQSSSASVLISDKKVKKIVTTSGADNSDRALKVRLRGRIRVLKNRLESRGWSLPA
jgi:broad-specificity NMP kinase